MRQALRAAFQMAEAKAAAVLLANNAYRAIAHAALVAIAQLEETHNATDHYHHFDTAEYL